MAKVANVFNVLLNKFIVELAFGLGIFFVLFFLHTEIFSSTSFASFVGYMIHYTCSSWSQVRYHHGPFKISRQGLLEFWSLACTNDETSNEWVWFLGE